MPVDIAIADLLDPRVAGYRDVRDRDLRGRDGLFVVESAKCVARLLGSRFVVESLLLTPERRAELGTALDRLPPETPIYLASEELLGAVSGYRIHGGALALAQRPHASAFSVARLIPSLLGGRDAPSDGLRPPRLTLLALAGVTHMDNVGSLFRSAAGLGADAILLDERCCDPLLRKPIRVAMGHSLLLPFAMSRDLPGDLTLLRARHGVCIVGLESSATPGVGGRSQSLAGLPRADRMALVLGNEGHGLDAELLAVCDALVEIPMRDGVPSINVAVAGALALWERGR